MDNKLFRYSTEIKIVQSSIKKLNPQFSLCDVLVCYHGDNRNMTSLPKNVIEENLFSIYGIPIVGEWIYKLDGTDEKSWGSHGGRIILDDKGIHFEQTTKPFGFVSKEAADNASWITITEKDGHTKNEYLKLSGCILWTDRYEESKTILDDNYGQSMEIEFKKGHYRDDHYYEAEEFIFSALCILGTDCEPCFESACIGRHYELDSFKKEFSLMLDEYKKFNESVGIITTVQNNNPQKGEIKMDLTNFTTLLSEIKYGDDCIKYSLLGADENNIFVVDREEGYKVYSVGYAEVDDKIVVNWNSKTEGNITYTEKPENEEKSNMSVFYDEMTERLTKEIEAKYETKLEEKVNEISADAEARFSEMKEKYIDIQNSYAVAKEKLDKFEAIEAEKAKENHINAVKETLERFEKKIGKTPEFIYYKAKVDYEKIDICEMEKELTLMTGDILMNKKDTTKVFSYNPTSTNVNKYSTENDATSRYGHLLDGFLD